MANITGLGRGILTGVYAPYASRRINPFLFFQKVPGISGTPASAGAAAIKDYFFPSSIIVSIPGYIRVWLGASWQFKPVKYWTGSAWVQKPIKFWNGTSWTPA